MSVIAGLTQPGDISTCISDVEALIPAIEAVVQDIESDNLANVISAITALVPQVEQAVTDCTGALKLVITSIKSETSVEKRIAQSASCMEDILGLIPTVEQIASDVEAENITALISDVEGAIPQLESVVSACASEFASHAFKGILTQTGTVSTCIDDIMSFATTQVPALVNDVESGNIAQLISDVSADIPTIEQAISDCSGALYYGLNPSLKKRNTRTLQSMSCIEDIINAIPSVESTVAAIEACASGTCDV